MKKMSKDLDLVMSEENARKLLEELKKENDATQTDVNKLLKLRLFYQKQKEHLLERHSQLKGVIDERQHQINQVKQAIPSAITKRFDQLFPLVEDVYFKELLLSELKEQLLLARIQQERSQILQVLQATDLRLGKNIDDTTCADNVLLAWHQYITCFIKENARISKQRNKKGSCLQKSMVFYNVKLHKSAPNIGDTLSFSTRHRGICVNISIKETRRPTDQSTFIMTSDLPLHNLQTTGEMYVQTRKNPVDFVMDAVWKQIEDNILCNM